MKGEMKICGKCGSERPDRGRCPECNRERQRKHYEEILDKIRERDRKYRAENPDKILGELL